jgi:hypothetical protein
LTPDLPDTIEWKGLLEFECEDERNGISKTQEGEERALSGGESNVDRVSVRMKSMKALIETSRLFRANPGQNHF